MCVPTYLSTKNPPECLANHFPIQSLWSICLIICQAADETISNFEAGNGRPKACTHLLNS